MWRILRIVASEAEQSRCHHRADTPHPHAPAPAPGGAPEQTPGARPRAPAAAAPSQPSSSQREFALVRSRSSGGTLDRQRGRPLPPLHSRGTGAAIAASVGARRGCGHAALLRCRSRCRGAADQREHPGNAYQPDHLSIPRRRLHRLRLTGCSNLGWARRPERNCRRGWRPSNRKGQQRKAGPRTTDCSSVSPKGSPLQTPAGGIYSRPRSPQSAVAIRSANCPTAWLIAVATAPPLSPEPAIAISACCAAPRRFPC